MNTASIYRSSALFRSFTNTCALLAFASLLACGTHLKPTVAEVSGRAVELVETGMGDATVVFESGLGNGWTPWDGVASEVAGRARVFAYSRPGYGGSEPSDAPRTAARVVEDLRTLLTARGFVPPYILVGHSFGGTYMELFAKAHPAEVAGLVLVDSRHRDFSTACQSAGLTGYSIPESAVGSLPQVQQDEFYGFASASAEIRAAGTFGLYPVRVLTSTSHPWSATVEALWQSMHGALAHEAANGQQIVFEGASHNLELDRAHEVAEVILSLIPESKH
ncbi:MAG TPA: alpha/beta hydrolase [Pseudomonadota bacterium]|nr:alpha/beta hydrolase [Pseudomonadota bacterium]